MNEYEVAIQEAFDELFATDPRGKTIVLQEYKKQIEEENQNNIDCLKEI